MISNISRFILNFLFSVILYISINILSELFICLEFRHMRRPKEDKDTFTDYLEWKDEIICSCTDMEDYCTGECSCKENDYKHHVDRRSSSSDDSVKELNFVVRKPKKKEKKRKRFTFFQSSSQNKKKEKEQEYRDRKCVKRRNLGTIEFKNKQDASRSFMLNNFISNNVMHLVIELLII